MFDLQIGIAIISGILSLLGGAAYVRDIFKGTTKPNSVSWFGWLLLTGLASSAQFASGASLSLIFVLAETLKVAIILLLSLKYGVRKYTNVDKACLILGVLGIILWRLTDQPVIAIFLAIFADVIFSYPIILKSIYKPNSETASLFILGAIGALFSVASTKIYDLPNLLYPAYLFIINAMIGLVLFAGQRRLKSE